MATAFLSIAGNDALNVFSKKSYGREAIRWLRPITENWHYSGKFDRKANTTEINSRCFSSANYEVFQLQSIPSNLGWGWREGSCFWGMLGERRRRVGDRDVGDGKGASVRFGGWPRSISNQTYTKWGTHSFYQRIVVHVVVVKCELIISLLIYIYFLSDLVESCLLTFAFASRMDQLICKQESVINNKVWGEFMVPQSLDCHGQNEWRHTDVISMTSAVLT